MKRSYALRVPIAWFVGFLMMTGEGFADPLTFRFRGVVDTVTPSLSDTFGFGDEFSGAYTFESTAVDTNPSPGLGEYKGAITDLTFRIGNYAGTADCANGACDITVQNGLGYCALLDCYIVQVDAVGPTAAGVPPTSLFISLFDQSGLAFETDALPLTPPDPTRFQTLFGLIFGFNGFVEGQINSLSAAPVPEPATFWMFGSGVAALLACRLLRRRED